MCKVSDEEGSLADLEDTNLLEEGGGVGEGVLCLDATGGGSIFANMSAINATLAGETSTCGVYGKGIFSFFYFAFPGNDPKRQLEKKDVYGIQVSI